MLIPLLCLLSGVAKLSGLIEERTQAAHHALVGHLDHWLEQRYLAVPALPGRKRQGFEQGQTQAFRQMGSSAIICPPLELNKH